MVRMWNYDKPHRCPECHSIWTYQYPVWEYDTLDGVVPRWWKTYTCQRCGAKFTGRWAWVPQMYYRTLVRSRYLYHELKWRLTR